MSCFVLSEFNQSYLLLRNYLTKYSTGERITLHFAVLSPMMKEMNAELSLSRIFQNSALIFI